MQSILGTLDAASIGRAGSGNSPHWASRLFAEPAPESMILWRHIPQFDAFTANSTDRNATAATAGSRGLVQRIVVPKGTPIARTEKFSVCPAEREWGLEGGSSCRVRRKVEKLPFDVPVRSPDGSTTMVRTELPVVNLQLNGTPSVAHLAHARDASATKATMASQGAAENDDDEVTFASSASSEWRLCGALRTSHLRAVACGSAQPGSISANSETSPGTEASPLSPSHDSERPHQAARLATVMPHELE
jgi:hypothetical protein